MKIVLFGATGMVGQGVLRECLADPGVDEVLAVGRNPVGVNDPKLRELVLRDLFELSTMEDQFGGYGACFFCLGVSSAGMSEADYRRVTYELTLAAATVLARTNPASTFVYVSGEGADSTEAGRVMWARVRGKTENAVLGLPFQGYAVRPGYIQPMDGIRSRTALTRLFYRIGGPLYPILRRIAPGHVTTTRNLGRAMLAIARNGAPERILYSPAINKLAEATG
jgi:uncharacterized protein YbjT (DUF2867 family)